MKSKLLLPGCFCKAGWGGGLVSLCYCFHVAFSMYMLWLIVASGTTGTKQNLWGHGREVCSSSARQERLVVCGGSPTSPLGGPLNYRDKKLVWTWKGWPQVSPSCLRLERARVGSAGLVLPSSESALNRAEST